MAAVKRKFRVEEKKKAFASLNPKKEEELPRPKVSSLSTDPSQEISLKGHQSKDVIPTVIIPPNPNINRTKKL